MNPSKDFKQISFNPFNFFNDQDNGELINLPDQQDMRDLDLNYFDD